jgi:hypothetical protein
MMNITHSTVYVCNKVSYGHGKSFDLICYPDIWSFRNACSGLFVHDQEFIYFDYEDIPDAYISEGWISPNYFPLIRAAAGLDRDKQEAFSAWLDCNKPDLEEKRAGDIINTFHFCYEGIFENPLLFTYEYACNRLNITRSNSPDFDFDGYKDMLFRDLFLFAAGGYIFKKIPIN